MNGPRGFPGDWPSPVMEGIDAPASPQNFPARPLQLRQGRYRPGDQVGPRAEIFDESKYVRLNGTIYTPVPNGSSALVLPESNQLRNFLGLRNSSAAAIVYVEFGTAASANSWLALTAGQIVLLDTAVPQDAVYAFGSAASAFLSIITSSTPGVSA